MNVWVGTDPALTTGLWFKCLTWGPADGAICHLLTPVYKSLWPNFLPLIWVVLEVKCFQLFIMHEPQFHKRATFPSVFPNFITSFKFLINNLKMFWILITFLITKISDEEMIFPLAEGELEETICKEGREAHSWLKRTAPSCITSSFQFNWIVFI